MATPTLVKAAPRVLRVWRLIIDAYDFREEVSKFELVPSTSEQVWTGGGGNTHKDSGEPSWNANVDYSQNWKAADSLANFLFDHAGEVLDAVFQPVDGEGDEWHVPLKIVPGNIGGTIGSFATGSISLPCAEKPRRVPMAPAGG